MQDLGEGRLADAVSRFGALDAILRSITRSIDAERRAKLLQASNDCSVVDIVSKESTESVQMWQEILRRTKLRMSSDVLARMEGKAGEDPTPDELRNLWQLGAQLGVDEATDMFGKRAIDDFLESAISIRARLDAVRLRSAVATGPI